MKIILNMTEGTFLVYDEEYDIQILAPLFEKQNCGTSRWCKTDKIIFVPEHLNEYITKKYDRVYP